MINIGIDWSETHHDVCSLRVYDAGAVVTRVTVPHSPDGFLKLETTRQQLGVTANECRVGLETAHNLLIRSASFGPKAIARREARHSTQGGQRNTRALPPEWSANR